MNRTSVLAGAGVAAFLVATVPAATAAPPVAYGRAEVAVGTDGGRNWHPVAGTPVHVVIHTRVRRAQVGRQTVFVRHFPGTGRCGASYAKGRGKAYGPFPIRGRGQGGYLSMRTGAKVTFRTAGTKRFCVWIAPTARTVVRPTIQDVEVVDELFAGSLTGSGSYWFTPSASGALPAAWTSWYAVGTRSFAADSTDTGCSGAPPRTATTTHEVVAQTGLATQAGGGGPVGSDTCDELRVFSYRRLQGIVGQLDLGSLTMTGTERRVRPPVVKRIGNGCALDTSTFANLDEAKAYVTAVGCTVGRVIRRPSSTATGQLIDYEIHGARARLATLGSQVDIVLSSGKA